jgi:hypothetical protein
MLWIQRLALSWLILLLWALPAAAQPSLRVSLTCDACDRAALQVAVPFVTILPLTESEATAEAVVVVTGTTLSVRGQGRFEGRNRTVMVSEDHARSLKLLLAEYAAETDAGRHLDVQFSPPAPGGAAGPAPPPAQRDPWNAWVFRVNGNVYLNGEQSASDRSYSYRVSANRTTEQWKLRVSSSRNLSRSSFSIDETTTITSRLSDWNVEGIAVRSLGPRWSIGTTSSVVGSSFSNSRRVARLEPGLEFDWFPYAESSRRSLTFMYSLGVAHYDYERETIFDKVQETVGTHALRSSLGLRQPWGQVGASVQLAQQLTAPERTRIVVNGNVSIRLLRSLTLTSSGTYSRLRDQFTLVKGNATDEEVLLRQRQLATGYRYSFSVGFGYAFGALGNTTVNPRFGGG